ncbi:MAG TPA: SMC-Scp complex subunit ScpB [Candidatus Lumbricidophila sp.]|nr:SMC-Scp complex subunit ScpB [Candidatus Lumbricidophila sp.]
MTSNTTDVSTEVEAVLAEGADAPDETVLLDTAIDGSSPEVSVQTTLDGSGHAALDLDRAVEALLFISDAPLSTVAIAAAVARPVAEVRAALARLGADYDGRGASGEPRSDQAQVTGPTTRRAFELREVGGGWRFYLRTQFDHLVADFVFTQTTSKLSQPALETLAVIAYKQPISRSQVASVRAVNVDSVVRTLVGRGLITEVDTDPETGAILYGTTDQLLVQLGLNSLDELPKISPLLDDGLGGFDV